MILEALLTAAGMLWKALWALVLGYLISAGIQVLVTHRQMAAALGERNPARAGLASIFGLISSSCSFAALAASRSVLVKGAHPMNSLAFLVASTNLVIELGIVLWVLLGWTFALGNFLLGSIMIVYAYLLTLPWFPGRLARDAREHAKQELSAGVDEPDDEDFVARSWRQKLLSREGWRRIAQAFFMEWKMVYKEILFGFTVAGFIAVFVPQSFWNALFLEAGTDAPSFPAVLQNAAIAPVVAFFTFIGSMGNVPLAAMLWSKNAAFGGVMSFLGADLVAATVVWIHVKYYGWRYAGYLSLLLYLCMVAAGVSVHYLYAAFDALPTARPTLEEMIRFSVDYTFWLNILLGCVATALLWLHFRSSGTNS
jgi:hypothetical protein